MCYNISVCNYIPSVHNEAPLQNKPFYTNEANTSNSFTKTEMILYVMENPQFKCD